MKLREGCNKSSNEDSGELKCLLLVFNVFRRGKQESKRGKSNKQEQTLEFI